MFELELYYFEGCPFCRKVINFIEAQNIQMTYKNIHEEGAARDELMKIGGKSQVPCMFVDGKPLYESNDIIEWLKENLESVKKK